MNILPFKKTVIGNIMISVKYDMLEDEGMKPQIDYAKFLSRGVGE